MKPVVLPKSAPDTRATRISSLMRDLMRLDGDKAWTVEVREETRTLQQNRWIWTVYQIIADYMRDEHQREYSTDAIHETLKERFIPCRVEQLASREVRVYRSTTKLTKREFGDYLEQVNAWCAEFGLILPEPDWEWRHKKTEKQAA